MRVLSFLGRLSAAICLALVLSDVLVQPDIARANQPDAKSPLCDPLCRSEPPTEITTTREDTDLAAALESVQFALSTISDGGTYVWRRRGGGLSGVIQPLASFRNANGRICRHLTLLLSQGRKTAKSEGVACRLSNGQWNLEG
jgi:17 kDa outer membrane surface antigen